VVLAQATLLILSTCMRLHHSSREASEETWESLLVSSTSVPSQLGSGLLVLNGTCKARRGERELRVKARRLPPRSLSHDVIEHTRLTDIADQDLISVVSDENATVTPQHVFQLVVGVLLGQASCFAARLFCSCWRPMSENKSITTSSTPSFTLPADHWRQMWIFG
jgi:hypothetical protein